MHTAPPYDPQAVEAQWQARWAERHTNEPDLDRAARPFYNLMMFPYPSADGFRCLRHPFRELRADDWYPSRQAHPAEHRGVPAPAPALRRNVRLAARALDDRSRVLQMDAVDLSAAVQGGARL